MIYFISGHRNITENEFNTYYVPKLDHAIATGGNFVVGDYYGVDDIAQHYLKGKVSCDKLTVYHMYKSPRSYVEGFKTKGGYKSDEERDAAMTNESDIDIAWSRSAGSGTERNLYRREEVNELKWLRFISNNIAAELKDSIRVMYEKHIYLVEKEIH